MKMSRWQRWAFAGAVLLAFSGIACEKPKTNAPIPPTKSTVAPPAKTAATAKEPSRSDWPQFHGPKRDNISPETGLLKKWPEQGPKLLWTSKGIGQGFGCPSIAAGVIFVSGNLNDKTTVTAMDLDGHIQWQTPAGDAWTGGYPGARGTPTIDGDRLYHESPLGQVVCLNTKTGQELWSVNILKEFDAANITWALAESVLIDGEHVICCPSGKKGSVVALDKNTGKTVWAAKTTGDLANYATPVLIEYQGLRILLTMNQKALIGVNADNGDVLFRYPHETKYDINATSPIFHDGRIFITSGYGSGSEMLKLVVTGKKASVETVWQSKELDNHHGGVILWDGCLYGAAHQSNGGRWICLAWKDGTKKYAEKGVGKGSLTFADGMLYCWGEKNGPVGLVPATPEKHEPVSRFAVTPGGDGPTWAHPVVCGGRLYLRHGNVLHAYDVRAEK
jgi:outer membrane protein assembly factor BamB